MFSAETLGVALHALATGDADRTANLILTSEELTDSERVSLKGAFDSSATPAGRARALGDAMRSGTGWDFSANECYRAAFYLSESVEELRSNELFQYFRGKRTGRVLDKWLHYFPVYTRHLDQFRRPGARILEVGVYRGGSLDMWNWYFGPGTTIVGIDIDERVLAYESARNPIEIGDQSDAQFLKDVAEKYGPFDVVIDDGGHEMNQQIVTATTLFPLLADGGVLLVEDTHTSYWDNWGGGRGRSGTFVEWAKGRIDDLHGYHQPEPIDRVWTDMLDSMHCYDSIVVLEKSSRFAPFAEQVGNAEFLNYPRSTVQMVSELVATRDAALAERDRYRNLLAAEGAADDDDLRQLRGELGALRPQLAANLDRLRAARQELGEARAAVRELRQALGDRDGAEAGETTVAGVPEE